MTETRTELRTETRTLDMDSSVQNRSRPPATVLLARAGKNRPRAPASRLRLQHGQPEIIALIEARRGAWSAPDLAELLGCSGKHIYALAKAGRMPHLRIDGMIRFDPRATAQWLRERFIAA